MNDWEIPGSGNQTKCLYFRGTSGHNYHSEALPLLCCKRPNTEGLPIVRWANQVGSLLIHTLLSSAFTSNILGWSHLCHFALTLRVYSYHVKTDVLQFFLGQAVGFSDKITNKHRNNGKSGVLLPDSERVFYSCSCSVNNLIFAV